MRGVAFVARVGLIILLPSVLQVTWASEELDLIEQVSLENRQKLNSFGCEFRVTHARANSWHRGWTAPLAPVLDQKGLFITDQGDIRYEVKCLIGEKTLAQLAEDRARTNGTFTSMDCASRKSMFSAKLNTHIAAGGLIGAVNFSSEQPPYHAFSPLALGIMGDGDNWSPVAWIQNGRKGKYWCRYIGAERIGDVELDAIECKLDPQGEGKFRHVWYLDLKQGAMPVLKRAYGETGELTSESRITLRRLENGAYLGDGCVTVYGYTHTKAVDVWTCWLTSVSLESPDRSQFALPLAVGNEVSNTADMRSGFRLKEAETLKLEDLQSWLDRCEAKLQETKTRQERRRQQPPPD